MKPNFTCIKCRKAIKVGKHLHASYMCPFCGTQMVIGYDERQQGHVNKKKNFFKI